MGHAIGFQILECWFATIKAVSVIPMEVAPASNFQKSLHSNEQTTIFKPILAIRTLMTYNSVLALLVPLFDPRDSSSNPSFKTLTSRNRYTKSQC